MEHFQNKAVHDLCKWLRQILNMRQYVSADINSPCTDKYWHVHYSYLIYSTDETTLLFLSRFIVALKSKEWWYPVVWRRWNIFWKNGSQHFPRMQHSMVNFSTGWWKQRRRRHDKYSSKQSEISSRMFH